MYSVSAENSVNTVYIGIDELCFDKDEIDSKDSCAKLQLKDNITAYIEKKELIRDIEPLECDSTLIEKVTSNYIIVKMIISSLSWQDKLICKLVCSTWRSAVQALQREQLCPEDFVVDLCSPPKGCGGKGWIKQSGTFRTEPLIIFAFANTAAMCFCCKCKVFSPWPCPQPCQKEHCLIDLINRQVNAPKNCMLTSTANYLVYRPLPFTNTYVHSITHYTDTWNNPFIAGIYIPKIPNVGLKTINIKSQDGLKTEFYDVVEKLSQYNIIKGVVVFVTDKYLLNSIDDIVFMHYLKDVQPNIPYALGGCLVEDTMADSKDIDNIIDKLNENADFISENLLSMCLFTVPKNITSNEYNFEMYSLVINSSEWKKPMIQQAITEFSNKVPRFEHSIALKLSCVGRDQKHVIEQDCFRDAFPDTPISGCYGNGELGINHPTRVKAEPSSPAAKRYKDDSEPHHGLMYSYSTVFVYFGWGKITSPKGPLPTSIG
ncbi:PREDICTED: uncharacterized protein LOC106109836 [Papilio polytes]|uniref:uncharacterized protein LOC106109836 n=1 Tax=Papilio polytes TaxID=76194 RepID=UPI000675C781|nr:PREDICTED: uncharacterized protein LOC106109836 [Papilio polytes]